MVCHGAAFRAGSLRENEAKGNPLSAGLDTGGS